MVPSWLVHLTLDQAFQLQALAWNIVLCSWARHSTAKLPLSTQVYKFNAGRNPAMDATWSCKFFFQVFQLGFSLVEKVDQPDKPKKWFFPQWNTEKPSQPNQPETVDSDRTQASIFIFFWVVCQVSKPYGLLAQFHLGSSRQECRIKERIVAKLCVTSKLHICTLVPL